MVQLFSKFKITPFRLTGTGNQLSKGGHTRLPAGFESFLSIITLPFWQAGNRPRISGFEESCIRSIAVFRRYLALKIDVWI